MNFKCLFIIVFLVSAAALPQNTVFIKYKSDVSKEKIAGKIKSNSVFPVLSKFNSPDNVSVKYLADSLVTDEDINKILVIRLKDKSLADEAVDALKKDNDIEYVEKGHTYKLDYVPNDSLTSQQWALDKIQAFKAWDITPGSDTIVIGCIDTGIDYLHPDIKNKMFYNKGEMGLDDRGRDKRFNGIDDDNNGLVDDYIGYDFVNRAGFPFDTTGGRDFLGWDNDPMDQNFHGTFTAGIIAAEVNNTIGIAGAAPKIKVLAIRCFDPDGYGEEDDVAAGLLYAVKMGVKVVNMSFGDDSFSYVLRDVVNYAYRKGLVLVASSGNSGSADPHYPSGYNGVISVGNSTQEDYVSSNSNYGSTLDLVAPGTGIWSLNKGGGYRQESGTSAAAPFVSAAAGLILSVKNFTNDEVAQILKSTSDDIGETGWDLRSGAGRLNMYKALSILAPAKVKINFPTQDFATYSDSLAINVTVMSPYFISYNLYIGKGLNPTSWDVLLQDQKYQISDKNIYNLNISGYKDTSYTIRLTINQSNGFTAEERTNFHIVRTAPQLELVGAGPVYYGNISTLMGEIYTSQRCITRLYYRAKGTSSFNFVTLDGFNTNNQFVKQLHYGFVPKQLVTPNTTYEVYFEAENLAGKKTQLYDQGNAYFEFTTDKSSAPVPYTVLNYKLPMGTLYKDPVSVTNSDSNQVLFSTFYATSNFYYSLFQLKNNELAKTGEDSLKNVIPIAVGDFNKDYLTEVIGTYVRNGMIYKQKAPGVFSFNNTYTDTTGKFYTVIAGDFDNSGYTKVITNCNDQFYLVYKLNSDLSLTLLDTLKNYSYIDAADSSIEFVNEVKNNVVIADANGDGKKEFWFTDVDGDVLSYDINGNSFTRGDSLITNLSGMRINTISAGDYNGDGVQELAVLFQTKSIAPDFMLLIFNFKNHKCNLISQKMFLDQSAEFNGFNFSNKVYQSLRFADIDNDGKDELVLNIFPYAYIFKDVNNEDKMIFYKEGVNTEAIFKGDLNRNRNIEIGLQSSDGYSFYEFGNQNKPGAPVQLAGYSTSKTSAKISWQGEAQKFYIYRAYNKTGFMLLDSTTANSYSDNNIPDSSNVFYYIKAYNSTLSIPLSEASDILEVYLHNPAKLLEAKNITKNTLLVKFDNKIKTKIENLLSFSIPDAGYPNSISPESEYSYLLTFRDDLPLGTHKLIIKGLSDLYNSPMAQDSITFTVQPVSGNTEFFISSYDLINQFKIKLTFNLPYDTATVTAASNYTFEPENFIESVETITNDNASVYLNLQKKRPVGALGREYVLRLKNVTSSTGTGKIKINDAAGSYVVLTGYTQNLADVYVYPNPAKVNSGSGSVTFANLPKKAKIVIFKLTGEQVAQLEESDGNGGLTYNLKDLKGKSLSTGVYIYRIVRLDDSNNEVEEKTGKFAVLK